METSVFEEKSFTLGAFFSSLKKSGALSVSSMCRLQERQGFALTEYEGLLDAFERFDVDGSGEVDGQEPQPRVEIVLVIPPETPQKNRIPING
eukprot:2866412-Amphidinium_carterae.1